MGILGTLFNGSSGVSLSDAKLEGLHYVHISSNELYQFIFDGVDIPEDDFKGTMPTQSSIDGRYAQGLLAAPSTTVYATVRDKILSAFPANTLGSSELAKFMAQVCVASCIASGSGVISKSATASKNLTEVENTVAYNQGVMLQLLTAYRTEFTTVKDDAGVLNNISDKALCTIGFEATNEAYAAFFHTNHHNGASARFDKGIGYAYVAAQAYLGISPLPVSGVSIAATFQKTSILVSAIMRDVIHDTNHQGRALLIYAPPADVVIPNTDHNRYSFSNAPAGASHISGAAAILSDAGALVHTSYLPGAAALQTISLDFDLSKGLDRFKYSPFAKYLTGTAPAPLPASITTALADAGALADLAQDNTFNSILTFLTATSFQAVAVRKHMTPAARGKARRYLDIIRSVAAQKAQITAADQNVAKAMAASVAAEISGLIL